MKKKYYIFLLAGLLWQSCGSPSAEEEDTPTSGQISASVDETLRLIADAEIDIFHHTYPKARINLRYRSENDCISDLYKDSAKVIFLGRALNDMELKAFQSQKYDPLQTKICTDAIVFLTHPKNTLKGLKQADIERILRGEVKNWRELGSNINQDITIVFDDVRSGTVNYVTRLNGTTTLPKNVFASKGVLDAVNYVSANENAIGIIGGSWISDSDAPQTKQILGKTQFIPIAPTGDSAFYAPYAVNIESKKYPFTRDVYMIQRERRTGLATGLTRFVYEQIGQLIILKAGLYPANQQNRTLEIVTKPAPVPSN